jgi:hypothetical protein
VIATTPREPGLAAGGGHGDLDSEGDGERSRLKRRVLLRLIAEARVGLRRNASKQLNNEPVLRIRSRSSTSRILANKRGGFDLDLVAGVAGKHARRRRRVLMRATR